MTAPTPPAARDAGVGELLPCPWCGGAAELIPMRSLAGDPSGHRVWCPNLPCCAAGPALDTEADAIAAWNRRAPNPPAAVDAGTLAEAAEWVRYLREAGPVRPGGQEEIAAFIERLATAAQPARAVPRITKDQAGAALSAVVAANREHIAAIISGADAVAIDKAEWAIQCACDDYFIALGFLEGDAPADASEAVRDGE